MLENSSVVHGLDTFNNTFTYARTTRDRMYGYWVLSFHRFQMSTTPARHILLHSKANPAVANFPSPHYVTTL